MLITGKSSLPITVTSNLRPKVLKILHDLPLHNNTLDAIEKSLNTSLARNDELANLLISYHEAIIKDKRASQHKSLEQIISNAHLLCNNDITKYDHLFNFRKHYDYWIHNWPYEKHDEILIHGTKTLKENSLEYLWTHCNVDSLHFENSGFMNQIKHFLKYKNEKAHLDNILNKRQINDVSQKLDTFKDISLESHILQEVFKQLHYLNSYGKVPFPIVVIPVKPLGVSIPNVRVHNLFKKKVSQIWKLLSIKSPCINVDMESDILTLLSNMKQNDRKQYRLYMRSLRTTYTQVYSQSLNSTYYRPASFIQQLQNI